MKFLNIKVLYFLFIYIGLFSCNHKVQSSAQPDLLDAKRELNNPNENLSDFLYTDLFTKVNLNEDYNSTIKYLADSVFVTYFDTINCFRCPQNELFIQSPSEYVQKLDIGEFSVIIADLSIEKRRIYFLLNSKKKIVDRLDISTYRNTIISQRVHDWDKDGNKDIVEKYKQQGQMFWAFSDVVYSIKGGKFKLIFSFNYKEIDCNANLPIGIFVDREYTKIDSSNFIITETQGSCSCDEPDNKESKYYKIQNKNTYNQTLNSLIDKYGGLYK